MSRRRPPRAIDELNKAHVFGRPIVTEGGEVQGVLPGRGATTRTTLRLHPDEPYIMINDAPKVVNLRKQFPDLYKDAIH